MTQNVLEFPRVGLYCRIIRRLLCKEKPERPAQDELIRDVNEDSKMSAFEAPAVETGPSCHFAATRQFDRF
jgi:hypothetical protein